MPCRRVFGWGTSRERDREEALSRYLRLLEAVFCGELRGMVWRAAGGILVGTLWKYPKVHHLEIHSKVTWKYPVNQKSSWNILIFFWVNTIKIRWIFGQLLLKGAVPFTELEKKNLLDLTLSLKMTFWTPTHGSFGRWCSFLKGVDFQVICWFYMLFFRQFKALLVFVSLKDVWDSETKVLSMSKLVSLA